VSHGKNSHTQNGSAFSSSLLCQVGIMYSLVITTDPLQNVPHINLRCAQFSTTKYFNCNIRDNDEGPILLISDGSNCGAKLN
jgi:hypothetical protein